MRGLVRQHIDHAVNANGRRCARQRASLAGISAPLRRGAARRASIPAVGPGTVDAQRELVSILQDALDARRQRIIVSDSHVNAVKWIGLLALATVMLVAIACVHIANRQGRACGDGPVRGRRRRGGDHAGRRRMSRSPATWGSRRRRSNR